MRTKKRLVSKTVKIGNSKVKIGNRTNKCNQFTIQVEHEDVPEYRISFIYFADEFLELVAKEEIAQIDHGQCHFKTKNVGKALTNSIDIFPNPRAKYPINADKCVKIVIEKRENIINERYKRKNKK